MINFFVFFYSFIAIANMNHAKEIVPIERKLKSYDILVLYSEPYCTSCLDGIIQGLKIFNVENTGIIVLTPNTYIDEVVQKKQFISNVQKKFHTTQKNIFTIPLNQFDLHRFVKKDVLIADSIFQSPALLIKQSDSTFIYYSFKSLFTSTNGEYLGLKKAFEGNFKNQVRKSN